MSDKPDLSQEPLSDREIAICTAVVVELAGSFGRFPAPVSIQGRRLSTLEAQFLADVFNEAQRCVAELIAPLLIQRIEKNRKIGK